MASTPDSPSKPAPPTTQSTASNSTKPTTTRPDTTETRSHAHGRYKIESASPRWGQQRPSPSYQSCSTPRQADGAKQDRHRATTEDTMGPPSTVIVGPATTVLI